MGIGYGSQPPDVFPIILALTRDGNCTPKVLATVIGHCPAVTRQILKIVNSAYDFLPSPIAFVQEAMCYRRPKTEPRWLNIQVVLGHFMFVYIHPYFDGNGRIGRFLMNVMLASGGYRWTVVPLDRRAEYMAALEQASVMQDITPFAAVLSSLVKSSTDPQYPHQAVRLL